MAKRYRDTKTGRFVSQQTWKRSKARGGTRYKREYIRKPEIPPAEPAPKPKEPIQPKPPGETMWRTVISRRYIRRTENDDEERVVYMGEVRATQYFATETEARAAVETSTTAINSRMQNIYDISLWSRFEGREPNVDVSAVSWDDALLDLGEMIGDYEEEYEEVVH